MYLLNQLELDIQKNNLKKTVCLWLCQGERNVIPPSLRVFTAAVVFSSTLATALSVQLSVTRRVEHFVPIF